VKEAASARQLAAFIAEYSPEVAKVARGALTKLRKIFPGYFVLVYDNYNALAIGFASSERAGDAICSLFAIFAVKKANAPRSEH
jgi:hypothetical protein